MIKKRSWWVRLLEVLRLRKTPQEQLKQKLEDLKRRQADEFHKLEELQTVQERCEDKIREFVAKRDAADPALRKGYNVWLQALLREKDACADKVDLLNRRLAKIAELIKGAIFLKDQLDNPANADQLLANVAQLKSTIDKMNREDGILELSNTVTYSPPSVEPTVPCDVEIPAEDAGLEARLASYRSTSAEAPKAVPQPC